MTCFVKRVKSYNYFSFDRVLVTLIPQSFSCRMTLRYIVWDIFRILLVIVNSDILRHIIVYSESCVILAYSEPCNIQNPGIFRIQDMFRTLQGMFWQNQNAAKRSHIENPATFGTLPYSELWHTSDLRHIQNFVHLGILRHIQ